MSDELDTVAATAADAMGAALDGVADVTPDGVEPGAEVEGAAATAEEVGEVDGEVLSDVDVGGKKVKLPPDVQAAVNERLREMNGKAKAAQAEAAALKEQAESGVLEAVAAAGLPPEYVKAEDRPVLQRFAKLERALAWCDEHAQGYESTGRAGDTENYTAEQVAAQRRKLEREFYTLAGRAEGVKTAASRQFLADAKAGRALREAATRKPAVKPGAVAAGKPAVAAAPRAAGDGLRRAAPAADFSAEGLEKAGGGAAGLQGLYEKLMG